jgi:hypothetical protein
MRSRREVVPAASGCALLVVVAVAIAVDLVIRPLDGVGVDLGILVMAILIHLEYVIGECTRLSSILFLLSCLVASVLQKIPFVKYIVL